MSPSPRAVSHCHLWAPDGPIVLLCVRTCVDTRRTRARLAPVRVRLEPAARMIRHRRNAKSDIHIRSSVDCNK